MDDIAICGGGNCCGVATGNTGAIFAGALGLTLPGAGTVPDKGEENLTIGRRSGEQILRLLEKGWGTREILTPRSFENAIRVFLAVGGSTNSLLHIMAIAHDVGIEIGLETFDRLSRETPHLTNVAPGGESNTRAAVGGPIGVVQDGDPIAIDLPARRISLEIPEQVIQARVARWQPPPRIQKGFLAIYQRLVQQASRGAILEVGD